MPATSRERRTGHALDGGTEPNSLDQWNAVQRLHSISDDFDTGGPIIGLADLCDFADELREADKTQ